MLTTKQLAKAIAYNQGKPTTTWQFALLVANWQRDHDMTVDGMLGPKTLASLLAAMPEEDNDDTPYDPEYIPQTWAEFLEHYGVDKEGSAWYRKNIVECHYSHGNQLPGAPRGTYVHLHRYAEPRIRRALAKASVIDYKIVRLGSFNFRERGSGSGKMSTHAGGAAIDINATQNKAIRFERGEKPVPWSAEWKRLWPNGVTLPFVEAMESEGLVWGGRFQTFVDPMHFQNAGINV